MAAPSLLDDLREKARRAGFRRFWRSPSEPTNFRARDASPSAVRADVEYGLICGRSYLASLRKHGIEPDGIAVVEIGPGVAFGGMAYLAAFGTGVTVADRWLAPWQDDYHRAYYAALGEAVGGEAPYASRIGALASGGGYRDGPITMVHAAAEHLHNSHDCAFDAVFSNAVLEHVYDLDATAASLFRATKPGGMGFHQVDFRDHRDFDRPLEHLLYNAHAWEKLSSRVHWEYGTQRRPDEYRASFISSGFLMVDYHVSESADPAYIDGLIPRLRSSRRSRYRDVETSALSELGGHFTLRCPIV